ncbi:MAG: winged helix-turn-helix transcriptional regulator [Alphaproteobacteria bacterium]|nr:winged helix-turn-helix transcriptional regulator [Alphaproteobacteria bacterium]
MSEPDRIFKALSDPIRIKILQFLRKPEGVCCAQDGVVCACDVESLLGVSQATVSHHMKLLVDAGLVRAQKQGRFMLYQIDADAFSDAMTWLAPFARAKASKACVPA